MTYSRNKEGAFCKKCVLFEPRVGYSGGYKLWNAQRILMVKFKDALQDSKSNIL